MFFGSQCIVQPYRQLLSSLHEPGLTVRTICRPEPTFGLVVYNHVRHKNQASESTCAVGIFAVQCTVSSADDGGKRHRCYQF